jgi:hypothetical protein
MTSENNITKIQKWYRKILYTPIYACKSIIEILNLNETIMNNCLFECVSISKNYPPQKNEYKFIYGKLVEISLLNAFIDIGFKCIDLDKNHKIGSEYKNDISIFKNKFSIKAKLNKGGDVILINKKSTIKHKVDINIMLFVINEGKLYIFPSNFSNSININDYIKEDSGCISYKSKLFTFINKNNKEYIYTFPKLDEEQKKILNDIKEKDIMNDLYNNIIKLKI